MLTELTDSAREILNKQITVSGSEKQDFHQKCSSCKSCLNRCPEIRIVISKSQFEID